jgi:phage gp36-like protein
MAYIPIVTPASLTNKVYEEVINTITRNDGGAIAQEAIEAAIAEAKIYLSRYDLVQLFGDPVAGTSATFTDTFLTNIIKDMALWQLFSLANPNISLELARTKYEDAKKTLREIQAGKADPRWPYIDTTGETAPQGNSVVFNSNTKRKTHF